MDPARRKRLEEDGWVFGDVQEFLGLTDDDMAWIEGRRKADKDIQVTLERARAKGRAPEEE